jgi:hypothetical protein
MRDMEPSKKLEKKEWDSFKKEVMADMGILNSKRVGSWLIFDAYRRDILWLESLLLSYPQQIREFDFALFIYLHISKYKIYLKKIL